MQADKSTTSSQVEDFVLGDFGPFVGVLAGIAKLLIFMANYSRTTLSLLNSVSFFV